MEHVEGTSLRVRLQIGWYSAAEDVGTASHVPSLLAQQCVLKVVVLRASNQSNLDVQRILVGPACRPHHWSSSTHSLAYAEPSRLSVMLSATWGSSWWIITKPFVGCAERVVDAQADKEKHQWIALLSPFRLDIPKLHTVFQDIRCLTCVSRPHKQEQTLKFGHIVQLPHKITLKNMFVRSDAVNRQDCALWSASVIAPIA